MIKVTPPTKKTTYSLVLWHSKWYLSYLVLHLTNLDKYLFSLQGDLAVVLLCTGLWKTNVLINAISYAHTGNCKRAIKSSNSCAKCYETSDVLKTPCRQNRLDAVCLNAIPGSGVCGYSANALAYVYHIYWVTSTAKWFYWLQKWTCLGFKHIEGT